ncbi:alpha/beta hydrolase [Neolewinella litorea]|uniref:Alpha/beta hydrolase n=1 Tax=Neolewinella litorea TaxID=2562452 RepID=A0A4S4N6Y2_9BACT|nr:alpha/beta hydrolase [Neolewinella litorea]THH34906.1 alpha/beta hydrolase [Neolewinella litorea]
MLDQICRALSDGSGLPDYWRQSAASRQAMDCSVSRHAYGPHRRQYLLLLEPPGTRPTDPLPWAFYFHGGGWTFGTPEAFSPAARPWLAAGFRVVLPSYRRPPRYWLPEIASDCRAAVAFTAQWARETGRPLSTPQVGGISAGGHLAALLALRPDWWTKAGWHAGPDKALLCAAPLDLGLLRPSFLFHRHRTLSPLADLSTAVGTQWLLLHGTHDGLVAFGHSRAFVDGLSVAGADARLITLPGGGHLDAGRWTYDDRHPTAELIAEFVRPAGPAPRGPG